MSDKNKELLFYCLNLFVILLSLINDNHNPILFALQCVFLAGVLFLAIPMIIKDIKAKKAAKQAAQDENEQ